MIGKSFILIGIAFIIIGIILSALGSKAIKWRLPGDIIFRRGNFTFYGQAESGIENVNTQNPTALAETPGLTSAMQALSDLVGGSYVYASYLGKEES